ncbi:universal stress protein [Desulfopila sp. IMCC35006]|uniref:universal stress protein n=1 Tax=Desulfopila sp. IMCC35006 TaxID=2569542 RepID=UPI0010AD3281|nr:universal stress protein [Desulfopila sp. IMCC35006]TKB27479.1 universal stress protein [Desulfopila sp. IMCC35006]
MDHCQLKGRPPFPFETIALVVTFSVSLSPLLSEAKHLADAFKAQLILISIDEQTPDRQTRLHQTCQKTGIGKEVRVIWPGGDPIVSLLGICKENMIDLLVLGALRRETALRYYLGSVARGLSRRAKCSLLLMTEPKIGGSTFGRIVTDCVDHRKTIPTLNTSFYFARLTGCHEMHIVKQVDQTGLAMAMSGDSTTGEQSAVKTQLFNDAEDAIREAIGHCQAGDIEVVKTVLLGRPGFMIRKYAEDCRANLLVINSPDSRYGLIDRIFPHDMEYILKQLPCNVLIVHSRFTNDT